ncbi:MAG: single-stranded DNA-binding protein [Firmicutes bacterium]|nr:single-stranded DNA-binding protein [Bacillota bacterium]
MNKVILIGRLTRDPLLKHVGDDEVAVSNFTVAVDRNYAGGDGGNEADFLPVVAWRKLAENCHEYLKKGSLVGVEGKMQVRSYEKDDERRWVTEVVAEHVKFLDKKAV